MSPSAGVLPSLVAAAIVAVGGCASTPGRSGYEAVGARHFKSRSDVVPTVERLLQEKDWPALADYYDLRGSGLSAAQLARGDYFYDGSRPGEEFRRYLHPFAPGAHFDHEMDGGEPDVIVLVIVLDVPNSRERLVYRFRVKRNGWGWQILP